MASKDRRLSEKEMQESFAETERRYDANLGQRFANPLMPTHADRERAWKFGTPQEYR